MKFITRTHLKKILERSNFFDNLVLEDTLSEKEVQKMWENWIYELRIKKDIKIQNVQMLFSQENLQFPVNAEIDNWPDTGYDECIIIDSKDTEYYLGVEVNDCQNYFVGILDKEPQVDFYRIEYGGDVYLTNRYKIKYIANKIFSILEMKFYKENSVIAILHIPTIHTRVVAMYNKTKNEREIEDFIQSLSYDLYDAEVLFTKIFDLMENIRGVIRVAITNKILGDLSEIISVDGNVTKHTYIDKKENGETKKYTVYM